MSELIHLRADIWAVKIADGAYETHLYNDGTGLCYWDAGKNIGYNYIDLGPGSYRLIGIWPGLTEQQAREVAEVGTLLGTFRVGIKIYLSAKTAVEKLFASKQLTGKYAVIKN